MLEDPPARTTARKVSPVTARMVSLELTAPRRSMSALRTLATTAELARILWLDSLAPALRDSLENSVRPTSTTARANLVSTAAAVSTSSTSSVVNAQMVTPGATAPRRSTTVSTKFAQMVATAHPRPTTGSAPASLDSPAKIVASIRTSAKTHLVCTVAPVVIAAVDLPATVRMVGVEKLAPNRLVLELLVTGRPINQEDTQWLLHPKLDTLL